MTDIDAVAATQDLRARVRAAASGIPVSAQAQVHVVTTDELIEHLKGAHQSDNEEIADWMAEYTERHPDMDIREHLWHLHDVQHAGWEGIDHTHSPVLPRRNDGSSS